MSTDLAAFISARLDEDEAAAGAGARRVGMPWRAEPQLGTPGGLVIDDLGLVGSTGGRYAAEHIARHDPARVLREVAAKRKILDHHKPVRHEGRTMCHSCLGAEISWPCQTLQHLAVIWADHPDYDPDWAPA
jgi:hypothetical protein